MTLHGLRMRTQRGDTASIAGLCGLLPHQVAPGEEPAFSVHECPSVQAASATSTLAPSQKNHRGDRGDRRLARIIIRCAAIAESVNDHDRGTQHCGRSTGENAQQRYQQFDRCH